MADTEDRKPKIPHGRPRDAHGSGPPVYFYPDQTYSLDMAEFVQWFENLRDKARGSGGSDYGSTTAAQIRQSTEHLVRKWMRLDFKDGDDGLLIHGEDQADKCRRCIATQDLDAITEHKPCQLVRRRA